MSLNKELPKFLIAGFSAVGTDALSYMLLLNWFEAPVSKGVSFILGSFVAFLINKFWTFETKPLAYKEIGRFTVLYSSTLGVNVLVNQLVLMVFPAVTFFAFLCATGASTVLNFIGMKFWVFNYVQGKEHAK